MLVVVSGSDATPRVIDRMRIDLVDESLPRQPYHAVAEGGLPSTVIDEVVEAATRSAVRALRALPSVDAVGVVAAERPIPSALEQVLRSHALLHAAEGQLYEQAVLDAADDVGLHIAALAPRSIVVPAAVEALGRVVGPPWQKDHKWATTAALAALQS